MTDVAWIFLALAAVLAVLLVLVLYDHARLYERLLVLRVELDTRKRAEFRRALQPPRPTTDPDKARSSTP